MAATVAVFCRGERSGVVRVLDGSQMDLRATRVTGRRGVKIATERDKTTVLIPPGFEVRGDNLFSQPIETRDKHGHRRTLIEMQFSDERLMIAPRRTDKKAVEIKHHLY